MKPQAQTASHCMIKMTGHAKQVSAVAEFLLLQSVLPDYEHYCCP